jgi:hypothetical protein
MIGALILVRRRRISRQTAGLDLIGGEACLGGVFAPRDQVLRGGFRCYATVLRGCLRREH